MSIISVNDLSKQYSIGKIQPYKTLRETLMGAIKSPVKLFSRNNSEEDSTIWALKNVSFEVKEGEVVGIIGRNGAGKTTLLKILSRVTEPTEGQVRLRGRVSSLLEVGTGFHPELTGRENIFLNGSILGMRRHEIKSKFDEIVAFAEIEKFIDTPVKRYSSGMYVRLAFAVAAHLEPEILIVDEVLAVGDIPFQKKCLGKIGSIAKGGRTVLFVSHNMEAVKKLCSHTMLLHQGKIMVEGSPDEVINRYLEGKVVCTTERVWPNSNKAPGDNVVRLKAAYIRDKNNKVCSNFDVRDPVSIELEYHVLEKGHRLVMHLIFTNQRGHIIFISRDNLDSPWKDTTYPVGRFLSTCSIPGDFLNEGEVSIYCAVTTVGQANTGHVSEEDLLIFRVSDRMDPEGVRGNYPLYWAPDGVRPRLFWTVENS